MKEILLAGFITFCTAMIAMATTSSNVVEKTGTEIAKTTVMPNILLPAGVLFIGTALACLGVGYRRRKRAMA